MFVELILSVKSNYYSLTLHYSSQAHGSNQTTHLTGCLVRQMSSNFQASFRHEFSSGMCVRSPTKQAMNPGEAKAREEVEAGKLFRRPSPHGFTLSQWARAAAAAGRNGGAGLDPGEGAEAGGADPGAWHGGAPGRGGRRRRLILLLRRRHLSQVQTLNSLLLCHFRYPPMVCLNRALHCYTELAFALIRREDWRRESCSLLATILKWNQMLSCAFPK